MQIMNPLNNGLINAIGRGDLCEAEACLEAGADIHCQVPANQLGDTFKLLRSLGVSGRWQDLEGPYFFPGASGDTPLHMAVSGGHQPMIKMLLRHGADPMRNGGSGISSAWDLAKEKSDDQILAIFQAHLFAKNLKPANLAAKRRL